MPYIKEERRQWLKDNCFGRGADNAGEMNYLFTLMIKAYIDNKKESYQTYNDIIGALEGAKLELYRRKVSLYEDKKRDDNGDVF